MTKTSQNKPQNRSSPGLSGTIERWFYFIAPMVLFFYSIPLFLIHISETCIAGINPLKSVEISYSFILFLGTTLFVLYNSSFTYYLPFIWEISTKIKKKVPYIDLASLIGILCGIFLVLLLLLRAISIKCAAGMSIIQTGMAGLLIITVIIISAYTLFPSLSSICDHDFQLIDKEDKKKRGNTKK